MADPVNLNRHRKQKRRQEARRRADANAAKFGRSKAERLLEAARREKARRMLDAHRCADEDEPGAPD